MGYDCFGGSRVVYLGTVITDKDALKRKQAQEGFLPFIELTAFDVAGTSLKAGWYEVTGEQFSFNGKTNYQRFLEALQR